MDGFGAIQRPAQPGRMSLRVGMRYRVDGILHEYLGPALLPGTVSEIGHVFLRNEWRPDTPGQLPLTLVRESSVDDVVTKTHIGGREQ